MNVNDLDAILNPFFLPSRWNIKPFSLQKDSGASCSPVPESPAEVADVLGNFKSLFAQIPKGLAPSRSLWPRVLMLEFHGNMQF